MTPKEKKNNQVKINVWAVIDENNKIIGVHQDWKYIAEMNAIFSDGTVIPAVITFKAPKIKKKI